MGADEAGCAGDEEVGHGALILGSTCDSAMSAPHGAVPQPSPGRYVTDRSRPFQTRVTGGHEDRAAMDTTPTPSPARTAPLSHQPLLVAAAALMVGGALLHGSARDTALFRTLNLLGAVWPTLWAMLSVAGLGLSAFIVLVALHRGAHREAMRPVAALLWCFPVGGALTHVLKRLIEHPRPAAALGADQIIVIGEPLMRGAMPSGHAVTTLAVLGLCLLAWRTTWLQRAGLLGLALLVLLSRAAVGAHWPADLCVGAGLGLVTAAIGWHLSDRGRLTGWLCSRPGQQVLAAAQIGCGIVMAVLHSGYGLALPLQWALGVWSVAAGLHRLGRPGAQAARPAPMGIGSEPG
jgi:undecaprenyl-diphosphatase